MIFSKYFKGVFIFQICFHGIYLLVKLVLVFYLFQSGAVDRELQTLLDIHDEYLITFLPQTCVFLFNVVALCLFRQFESAKKKQKKSLATEYQLTKLLLLLLLAMQPLFNQCLLSVVYILLIPLIFLTLFIKTPLLLIRIINVLNCVFFFVQNVYQSAFYTMNTFSDEILLLNQLLIIIVLDKEITNRNLEVIMETFNATSIQKKKKFVPRSNMTKLVFSVQRALNWIQRLIRESDLLNYPLSNFLILVEIQRYLSYLSLVQMFFLFFSFFKSSFSNRFVILTVFIIPIAFLRLIFHYLYNIRDHHGNYMIGTPDSSPDNLYLFEFTRFPSKIHIQPQNISNTSNITIEYIFQMSFIFLQFVVVFTLRRMMLEAFANKRQSILRREEKLVLPVKRKDSNFDILKTVPKKAVASQPYDKILKAVLIKAQYIISFMLSMLTIFWISLSAVNIFHFMIAIFFVIILLNLNGDMFSCSADKLTVYWRRLIILT